MKKETIYVKYKFEIEYETKKRRSEILRDIVRNCYPSCFGFGVDGAHSYKRIGNGRVIKPQS